MREILNILNPQNRRLIFKTLKTIRNMRKFLKIYGNFLKNLEKIIINYRKLLENLMQFSCNFSKKIIILVNWEVCTIKWLQLLKKSIQYSTYKFIYLYLYIYRICIVIHDIRYRYTTFSYIVYTTHLRIQTTPYRFWVELKPQPLTYKYNRKHTQPWADFS